jgi:toxin CcdB
MKQFWLYKNQNKDTNQAYPYFVDVQNELLEDLKSRVVIPIIALEKSKSTHSIYPQNLCPIVEIGHKKYVVMTHQMTSVPTQMLKNNEGSLLNYRDEIIAAIDFLVTGI